MKRSVTGFLLLVDVGDIFLPFTACKGFLLDGQSNCPNTVNCTCRNGYQLYCAHKGLSAIPAFNENSTMNITQLDLSGNHITTMLANAFRSLENSSVLTLNLYSNEIASISTQAFAGVDNITNLNLQNNRLTSLPQALETLDNLKILRILGNHLLSLDQYVMAKLGNSLTTLYVDIGNFSKWPVELRYARHLQLLQVEHVQFSHLDADAFHGFQSTLQTLFLFYTKLQVITSAICDLSSLRTLRVRYSPELNETRHRIFESCHGQLSKVTLLELYSNMNMSVFPVLGETFSSIQTLEFQSSAFEIMNPDVVTHAAIVTRCSMYSNKLVHIPYAVNKFVNLHNLELQSNSITYVDDPDLVHLKQLQYLYLQNNPLKYISNNAFKHNTALSTVNLDHTLLHTLPTSLSLLQNLRYLYLRSTLIECTCDLANLKSWDVTSISFSSSKCYQSDELIKSFITNDLKNC